MTAGTISVRQTILEKMAELLLAMDPLNPYPNEDPPMYKCSAVEHGPLDQLDARKRLVCGLVPGREIKTSQFPWIDVRLSVAVEFRFTVNKEDPVPGLTAEQVLTDVQRTFFRDTTMGGLTADVIETGSEIDLMNYTDRSVQGVVFFDIRYRHSHTDPRDPNPTV